MWLPWLLPGWTGTIFSIRRFENWKIEKNKEPLFRAFLESVNPGKVRIEFGEIKDTTAIEAYPWHSYDFDFSGLGFSWRAVKDKRKDFSFHIADAMMNDGKPSFGNKGAGHVKFELEESINDKKYLKYSINGEGLANKGGTIWIDPVTWMIQRYKIALPDEEGFKNGYLNLLKKEKMSPEAWDKFIREKVK